MGGGQVFLDALKSRGWNLYLLGGVVRDSAIKVLSGIEIPMSDLDFVVEGCKSQDDLREALSGFKFMQNSFGGFKVIFGDLTVDVWRIEDQLGINDSVGAPTILKLLHIVTTSADAIAFDFFSGKIIDQGALNSISQQTIGLNLNSHWTPRVVSHHIAHIAKMMGRTDFVLSGSLRNKIKEWFQFVDLCESKNHLSKDVGAHNADIFVDRLFKSVGVSLPHIVK